MIMVMILMQIIMMIIPIVNDNEGDFYDNVHDFFINNNEVVSHDK